MSTYKGKNILITGGASGIGKLMGEMALKKGAATLVIWDINQANIDATKAELSQYGRVCGMRVDVSNYEVVASSYEQVKGEVGHIDILINCAGIVTGNKTFDKQSIEEIVRTMEINAIAPW